MKKYQVTIIEKTTYVIDVDAFDEDDATDIAYQKLNRNLHAKQKYFRWGDEEIEVIEQTDIDEKK